MIFNLKLSLSFGFIKYYLIIIKYKLVYLVNLINKSLTL